jgi:RNA polymerase sigma-70 factor, ECF subfamily
LDDGGATDDTLVRRLIMADESALEELYDRYGSLVFSLALRMLGTAEAAEDVVQDAFYRVWRQAAAYDASRGRLSTWLMNIARNLCIDELRRRAVRPQLAVGPETEEQVDMVAAPPETDPAEQLWVTQRRAAVATALANLPAPQREALELAYFVGLSQSEIALRLGEPLGTIKTRIRLGMQKLRESLGTEWWIGVT